MQIKKLTVGYVQTNCYIVSNEETKEAVIVDPGDRGDLIIECCKREGLDVKAILLTHGHSEHIGALDQVKRAFGAKVYALEDQKELMADENLNLSKSLLGTVIRTEADVWLRDNETVNLIGLPFQVIATPGHTEGSCCYYIESEKALFAGDTLFEGSYGRVDLPGGSSVKLLHSVLDRLFELPEDVTVYPGHLGYTTIGDEKKYNPLAPYKGKLLE